MKNWKTYKALMTRHVHSFRVGVENVVLLPISQTPVGSLCVWLTRQQEAWQKKTKEKRTSARVKHVMVSSSISFLSFLPPSTVGWWLPTYLQRRGSDFHRQSPCRTWCQGCCSLTPLWHRVRWIQEWLLSNRRWWGIECWIEWLSLCN